MRRLVPVLVVLTLALLCAAGAVAAAKKPWPRVVEGAGHVSGTKAEGWFFVKDTAARPSRPAKVYTGASNPAGTEWLGYRTAPSLRPGKRHRMRFSYQLPKGLAAGAWTINLCTGGKCLHAGHFTISGPAGTGGSGTAAPPWATKVPAELGNDVAPQPISTVPTAPIPHPTDEPFLVNAGPVSYYGFVPDTYDPTNATPTTLLVWLHGCYGEAEGDAWVVDPGTEEDPQDYLTLSLAGRESPGDPCWHPSVDEPKVMAALADFETHFNVDRRRVILAGYSSGGDLAYRTGFFHSSTFAGLLIENSSPFRDTGASEAELLGAATTKLHIVHLAHTEDGTYPIAGVRAEVQAVEAAGFPIQLIEAPGGHSDATTDPDKLTYLLPHIDDGWLAPASP